jgi:hypothetical protein
MSVDPKFIGRRDAVLAEAMQRAHTALTLQDLDFDLICQVRVTWQIGSAVVSQEDPCSNRAAWWIECRVCGAHRLSCDDHAGRVARIVPVFCHVCRHEKPTAEELYSIAPLPVGV